jgi:hypothetical protein
VSFGVVVALDSILLLVRRRHKGGRERLRALMPPLWIAAGAVATVVVLALPRALRVLRTDYADRFSGFKVHTHLFDELWSWVHHFGALSLALFIVAAAGLAATRGHRRIAVLLVSQLVLTFTLVRQIQDPSPQHWYLYLPVMMTLAAVFLVRVVEAVPRRNIRLAVAAGGTILSLAISTWTVATPVGFGGVAVPGPRIRPQVRSDLTEIRRLLAFLDTIITKDPGYIYVIGVTPPIADTSLAYANLSLQASYSCAPYFIETSHMDHRDGFPTNLFFSRYVVVTSPIGCRKPAIDQQVVEIPGTSMLESTDIGRAFRRLDATFNLSDGVQVFVFKRIRPFTDEEIQSFVRRLEEAYPDRPELLSPPDSRLGVT